MRPGWVRFDSARPLNVGQDSVGVDTVLTIQDDLVFDLDHEVSSLTGGDINSAHHPLTEAPH